MPAKADETAIVGTWQLKSFSLEWQDTKELVRPYNQPTGYLQYSPGGHMSAFVAGEFPQSATPGIYTDAERVDFYRKIIGAYDGSYRIEGDKVIHHVLTAWFPAWIGTSSPDRPIQGCTAVIQTGRQLLDRLATAYNNRGVAWRRL